MTTEDILREFERRFGKTFEIDELSLNRNIQLANTKELIKSFLTTILQSKNKEVVKMISELDISKPQCENDEVPYEIKKMWLKETKQALLDAIKTEKN